MCSSDLDTMLTAVAKLEFELRDILSKSQPTQVQCQTESVEKMMNTLVAKFEKVLEKNNFNSSNMLIGSIYYFYINIKSFSNDSNDFTLILMFPSSNIPTSLFSATISFNCPI